MAKLVFIPKNDQNFYNHIDKVAGPCYIKLLVTVAAPWLRRILFDTHVPYLFDLQNDG